MSSFFSLASLPACDLTPARRRRLEKIANALTPGEIAEFRDTCHGCAEDEVAPRVLKAIEAYGEFYDNNEVGELCFSISRYFTGGMSFGDNPTEAYPDFTALSAVSRIYKLLTEWAAKDKKILTRNEAARKVGDLAELVWMGGGYGGPNEEEYLTGHDPRHLEDKDVIHVPLRLRPSLEWLLKNLPKLLASLPEAV